MKSIYKYASRIKTPGFFAAHAAAIICLYFLSAATVTAGGPNGTPSHGNDRPGSMGSCAVGSTRNFSVGYLTAPGRSWNASVVVGSSWVTITNTAMKNGSGFVNYQITPNYSSLPRTGIIAIDGAQFSIEQRGFDASEPCPLQVTPQSIYSGFAGGLNTLDVNDGGQMLRWQVSNPAGDTWVSFDPSLQIGSAQTFVWLDPNYTTEVRMTTLFVGNVKVPVIQTGVSY